MSFGYGQSFLFVFKLYQQVSLAAIQKANREIFALGQRVDWFDYLEILETASVQELGQLFIGWVVPHSFDSAFGQWQQVEKGYRQNKTLLREASDRLGIVSVERRLPNIKSLIMNGEFSEAATQLQSVDNLVNQWQESLKVYRDAEIALTQPADTMGLQIIQTQKVIMDDSSLRGVRFGRRGNPPCPLY